MATNTLIIYLHTLHETMAEAWRTEFSANPEIHVVESDILAGRADSILSPANSFGYMDGGIDLAYRRFFGDTLETNLRRKIREDFFGEAALIAVLDHNQSTVSPIRTIRSPALGTGIGAMPMVRAARQMQAAYTAVFGDPLWLRDPSSILVHHKKLRTV